MLSKNNEEHLWADKRVKEEFLLQVSSNSLGLGDWGNTSFMINEPPRPLFIKPTKVAPREDT